MIFIALGANLPSRFGMPVDTLQAALAIVARSGIEVVRCAPWYESAPVPASDQPWYVNSVAQIITEMSPGELLTCLHAIETRFGRVRGVRNEARGIDLDLIDHNGLISTDWPVLPHPRLQDRAFVLLPLAELAPDWLHPVTGEAVSTLIARLDPTQVTRRIAQASVGAT